MVFLRCAAASGSEEFHGKRDRMPVVGGRENAATAPGTTPGSARHAAKYAASSTERANKPAWSSVSAKARTPATGNASKLGLYPTTPQKAAGRMTDPFVCVPIATGT